MSRTDGSLHRRHPGRLDVWGLVVASILALAWGLTSPFFRFETMIGDDRTYSVLSGVLELFSSGHAALAALIFGFSVLFPAVKLVVLLAVWFAETGEETRRRALEWVGRLGKWSMLDVFVVVLLAGLIQLGLLAEAEPRHGVFVFGGAILLSMVAGVHLRRVAGAAEPPKPAEAPPRRLFHLPVLSALSLALLCGGLALPLMSVEKWVFWKENYSILGGTLELVRQSRTGLAMGVATFVIALPLAEQVGLTVLSLLQAVGRSGGRMVPWLLRLEEWAMLDVFALALIVVGIRIGDLVRAEARVGLLLFAGSVALSTYVSWRLRRLYRSTG